MMTVNSASHLGRITVSRNLWFGYILLIMQRQPTVLLIYHSLIACFTDFYLFKYVWPDVHYR
jgi:hypothetical protein